MLVLAMVAIAAIGTAVYGYLESQRTEKVVIAKAPIPYGTQITPEMLETVEVALHRPVQFAGITDAASVVGQWAARQIGPEDLLKSDMLMANPPTQPVFPNGSVLPEGLVTFRSSVSAIGVMNPNDLVNIGFDDPTGDPKLCRNAVQIADTGIATAAPEPAASDSPTDGTAFTCRMLSNIRVLYLDGEAKEVYLGVTPYQALALRAVTLAQKQLWFERYGSSSSPLAAFDRLDVGQIEPVRFTEGVSATLTLPSSAPAAESPANSAAQR
jgi:Flp pilus assembly protein CpaB